MTSKRLSWDNLQSKSKSTNRERSNSNETASKMEIILFLEEKMKESEARQLKQRL